MSARDHGLLLHASAVASPRGAILFAGASGAGKSTMAALLHRHTGWPVIADDVTHLRPVGSGWVVEDGCHALALHTGKQAWPFSPHRDVPARLWCAIRQAGQSALAPLSPGAACARMLQAWLEVAGHASPYRPAAGWRVFPRIAALARMLPAATLDCTLGVDTVNLICDYIK